MSNDMNLIMENWRRSPVLTEGKIDLFEDLEYIKEVLGIQVPLNENNESILSEELKEKIVLEQRLLTEFFERFNPMNAIKKYGKEIGDMFVTLKDIIKDKSKIPTYIKSLMRKIITPQLKKIKKLGEWVATKGYDRIAGFITTAYEKMFAVVKMGSGWKKAALLTGLIVGIYYTFGKLKDAGIDMATSGWDQISQLLTGFNQEKLQNILLNFFMKTFPKIVGKFFAIQALAGTTGFLSYMALLAPVLEVLNLARDQLRDAIKMFRSRTTRGDGGI